MPVRNTPSNVPAPPIATTGALIAVMRGRLRRSAPISAPSEPATYATDGASENASRSATPVAVAGGVGIGTALPTPGTTGASRCTRHAPCPIDTHHRHAPPRLHQRPRIRVELRQVDGDDGAAVGADHRGRARSVLHGAGNDGPAGDGVGRWRAHARRGRVDDRLVVAG